MQSFGDLLVKIAQGVELTRSERDLMKDYADTFRRAKDEMYVSNSFKNTTLLEGVEEAPSDSKFYSRYNKRWEVTTYPHYYNLTSQVNGSRTNFTIVEPCWNLIILINGLAQGENDFVYDFDGLGFTLDNTLVSGDILEVFIFPGTPIAGLGIPYNSTGSPNLPVGFPGKSPVRLSWDRYHIHAVDTVLSAFSDFSGTLPANPSFPPLLKFPITTYGDEPPVLTCYALNGETRVLTASMDTNGYAYFNPTSDTAVTGFELALGEAGPWIYYPSPPAVDWKDIAWSASLFTFAAVGTDAVMGIATSVFPCPTGAWKKVIWIEELSKFVAITGNNGSDQYMTSSDGVNWTAGTLPSGSWTCLAWSPELSLLVALGVTGVNTGATSPDGINWTPFVGSGGQSISAAWSPALGLFASVGLSNSIRTSPDGVTWTERTTQTAQRNWGCIAWSPALGAFVALSSSGLSGNGNKYAISTDGINWTIGAAADADDLAWAADVGVFMATRIGSPYFMASSDGINWKNITGTSDMAALDYLSGIGRFAAVGNGTFAISEVSVGTSISIENALLYGAK